jgi:manganese-dependent ADP-ribose/CDP-alcohol diphosphatase
MMKRFLLIGLVIVCHRPFSQAQEKALFTFGVIADVQYADQDNAGTRHYRLSPKKFADAVDSFNLHRVDFILSLGDYIDKNLGSYDTLNPIKARLKMPLYHILGNHEFSVADEEKSQVLKKEGLNAPYYSFVKKNWRFIIVNGNDISLHGNTKNSKKYQEVDTLLKQLKALGLRQAQTWNGAIGKEQLLWLQNELKAAQTKKENVVIANHFPLYPDEATELLWNAKEVRQLIESYSNVFAYLNGHVHKSQYFAENGVHYVSFRGMVELEDNAYAIVTVYENHLEIKGFGKEVSRSLK